MAIPSYLFALHVAIRVVFANTIPIADCDEIFNYWEPLHFVTNGVGLQTWEYAPDFALRTYIYLLPLSLLEKAFQFMLLFFPFGNTNATIGIPQMFYFLRCAIAMTTGFCEIRLVSAMYKHYSQQVSYLTWCILLCSTGMFHTAAALLPSASVMNYVMLSISDQFEKKNDRSIIWGLLACLTTGWPFCSVLFVPLAIQQVYEKFKLSLKEVFKLIIRVGFYSFIIQSIVMITDWCFYGKLVSPTLNIFLYNTSPENRDHLYGIEDISFYIKNLILNWNIMAVLGFIWLPWMVLRRLWNGFMFTILAPLYLWLMLVMTRPHKEERFLYPIYSMIAIGAGCAVNHIVDTICRAFQSKTVRTKRMVALLILLPFASVSLSRSFLLFKAYNAPIRLYSFLFHYLQEKQTNEPVLVCVGLEWFRFPSSYFLPDTARLGFLPSQFSGQLPQYFTPFGSKEESKPLQGKFNDINASENDRFVAIADCSFVIELIHPKNSFHCDSESILNQTPKDGANWIRIASFPFLDNVESPMFHRLLYIPFLHHGRYSEYTLYERVCN